MHSGFSNIIFLKNFLSLKPDFPLGLKIGAFDNILHEEKVCPLKKITGSYTIKDIPNYLTLNYTQIPKDFTHINLDTLEGYYIDLAYKDIKDYMRQQFSSKSRWSLYRDWGRMEQCFAISYVVYYGSIDKELYRNLFQRLREMMVRRFNEKAEANYELPHLAEIQEVLYDLIQQKKANLYVIYHNNRPISIRINMFKNELAYYILSAYDIDYSKFHLGHLDMLQNISWCINKKFKIYDLLKGYYDYKKKWITHSYTNQTHVLFPKSKTIVTFKGYLKVTHIKVNYLLLNLAKQLFIYKTYKSLINRNNRKKYSDARRVFIVIKEIDGIKNTSEINILEDSQFHFLKRPVFDFLYVSKIALKSIRIFKTQEPGIFQISGAVFTYLVRKDIAFKFKTK